MIKALYLIPARGGSKGIPGKNIKPLEGKPLICYSIDTARALSEDAFICVSTDSDEIISVVENYGLKVPFKRPAELATDHSGSYEVILHALEYYRNQGHEFDCVVLLQPTSPFRKARHVNECLSIFETDKNTDMVVTVKEGDANPYYSLFEENEGYLEISKKVSGITRRQDAPPVYQFNGAVYVINVHSIYNYPSFTEMKRIKKLIMNKLESLDIDEPIDWYFCETLIKNKIITI